MLTRRFCAALLLPNQSVPVTGFTFPPARVVGVRDIAVVAVALTESGHIGRICTLRSAGLRCEGTRRILSVDGRDDDGAALPGATGANPSSTIAAVAERCIEVAVRRITGNRDWSRPSAQGWLPTQDQHPAGESPQIGAGNQEAQ